MATKNDSMWGKHSAERGWILNCLKSQTQPIVYSCSSASSKARVNSTVVTWHTKTSSEKSSRPKELFFPIKAEGVYQVDNHADHGGYKLVYQGATCLSYKTIKPDDVAVVFQRNVSGEAFSQIAASI
ncbi:hypothetical protein [Aquitalea magnusonii]|uniref:hypothetical protein n=1 Tax=Aquitalea magnusonii TaxID=332411 RepID=UPI0011AE9172|nr:hypothetical protein [Aquitalea magnusonii]